jgi:16S rRNA U516 pseudouridylate synthase RsuA-like enzyme
MKRITENKDEINAGRVVYYHDKKEIHFKLEPFINFMKYKKILIDKAWVVMFFKQRGVVTAVGKDKDRKSYRYQVMQLSDDEALDIDSLLRVGEVI